MSYANKTWYIVDGTDERLLMDNHDLIDSRSFKEEVCDGWVPGGVVSYAVCLTLMQIVQADNLSGFNNLIADESVQCGYLLESLQSDPMGLYHGSVVIRVTCDPTEWLAQYKEDD